MNPKRSSGNTTVPTVERRISDKRIRGAKLSTIKQAISLEKAENGLADVNARLNGLTEAGIFSSERARLEMDKKALEAKVNTLRFKYNSLQSRYFQYLEKNDQIATK